MVVDRRYTCLVIFIWIFFIHLWLWEARRCSSCFSILLPILFSFLYSLCASIYSKVAGGCRAEIEQEEKEEEEAKREGEGFSTIGFMGIRIGRPEDIVRFTRETTLRSRCYRPSHSSRLTLPLNFSLTSHPSTSPILLPIYIYICIYYYVYICSTESMIGSKTLLRRSTQAPIFSPSCPSFYIPPRHKHTPTNYFFSSFNIFSPSFL